MAPYLPVAFHARGAFFEVEALDHRVATEPLFDMQQRLLHLHLTLLLPCATLITAAPFILHKEREQVGLLDLGGTSPTHIPRIMHGMHLRCLHIEPPHEQRAVDDAVVQRANRLAQHRGRGRAPPQIQ